jgi:hypothetical protein
LTQLQEFGTGGVEPICRVLPIAPSTNTSMKSHRIVGLDVIVNRLRQQQKLVSSESGDVSHARF